MFITTILIYTNFFACVLSSPLIIRNSTQQWEFSEIPPSKDLVWYPCNEKFYCAMLDVPLDYKKPDLGGAYVPVVKYPATTTPYKGMVLTNPGGPGDSGVAFLFSALELGTQIVGTNYDLVSWDPRGVNNSVPAALCKLSPKFTGSKLKQRELDKLYGPNLPSVFFQDAYAEAEEIAQECGASIGGPNDAGPHMTTSTVARDMISILDAFQSSEDGQRCNDSGLLNYWGISYGTFLGETFASMFPHRIGRVVLDGVMDPDEWIKSTGKNMITYSDDAFATFFLYCNLAGPSLCPFHTGNTAHDIFLRFEAIVTQLNATQAFEQGWSNATAIELLLTGIKEFAFGFSYSPLVTFPVTSLGLILVESLLPDLTLAKLEALTTELV